MKKHLLTSLSLLVAAGWLSACASTPSESLVPDNNSQATINSIHYHCEQGFEPLEMRYYPYQDKAELVLNTEVIELPQQRAASGFWYSNGQYTVRGKGNELWLEIGRRVPIECEALD